MTAPKRANPHEMARDAAFRSPDGLPAMKPGGVVCKACHAEQVIPIPIWDLMAESEEKGVWGVPVAMVCMACHVQTICWAEWRLQEGENG